MKISTKDNLDNSVPTIYEQCNYAIFVMTSRMIGQIVIFSYHIRYAGAQSVYFLPVQILAERVK